MHISGIFQNFSLEIIYSLVLMSSVDRMMSEKANSLDILYVQYER